MSLTNGSSQPTSNGDASVLQDILASLRSLQQENAQLAATVDAISGRVNVLAGVKQTQDGIPIDSSRLHDNLRPRPQPATLPPPAIGNFSPNLTATSPPPDPGRRSSVTSKIILTSYPGQAGVDPLPMSWGAKDPNERGPVVVSRNPSTFRRRNGQSLSTYAVCNIRLTSG